MRSGLIVALAVPVLAAVTAGAWYVLHGDKAADEPDPAHIAQGQQLYAAHCAACHGVSLEGEAGWQNRRADGTLPAPPQDATGHTWHHPDQQLFVIVRDGVQAVAGAGYKTSMQGFGDVLSDEEIRAVLDFIKSRWPEDIRARQAEVTRRAGG